MVMASFQAKIRHVFADTFFPRALPPVVLLRPVPVMDGFRRYAHARVITDFKNMADYMKSEHWLKASEKAKTKTRTTATRLQETPENR